MVRKPASTGRGRARSPKSTGQPSELRIIGGEFRGRKLEYAGDPRVRPMKDRLREALFNLVGPAIKGKHAIDLFTGTGAIGLEAISRGATQATLVERHFPTARIARENAAVLGVSEQTEVVTADTFLWARGQPTRTDAWAVFCSPPYDFYIDRAAEMIDLIGSLVNRAPSQSVVVVEADRRFGFEALPHPERWDVRSYPPAVIGLLRIRD